MRILLVLCVFILSNCSLRSIDNTNYRLYQIYDMDEFLLDYYTNDLKKINPGLACGDFKNENNVGCFKLLVNTNNGKVEKLVYHELSSVDMVEIYKFDPPVNYVFIEKIYTHKLKNSNALAEHEEVVLEANQPSLKLVFFEKSEVVFYWKNGSFHKIWTAD